jgi:uncharacterized protein with PIN domain
VLDLAASGRLKFGIVSLVAVACPRCNGKVHHSRPRSWLERLRRRVTRRVPYRCHTCNWRGWRKDVKPRPQELRRTDRALTDAEIERLEPDDRRGERP